MALGITEPRQARTVWHNLTYRCENLGRVSPARESTKNGIDHDHLLFTLAAFARPRWKEELARHPRLALLGDYNIAPDDRDVHDPADWADQVLCSEAERAQFRGLLGMGLKDAFRLFEQPEKSYSWWDYRMAAFRRNLGLRIDHILLSSELAAGCKNCRVDDAPRKLERPSDHAPVIAKS